ncbi:hypothetical protein FJZ31_20185 [Candidatus Poribacteria bacterium]|nr:hypothetical protein [Candidatus Poribacteria bacterium]
MIFPFSHFTYGQLILRKFETCPNSINPTPKVFRNNRGERLTPYNGKPAALFEYVQGWHIEQPNAHHLEAVGRLLGKLHLTIADFVSNQPRHRGVYLPINQLLNLKEEQAYQILGLDYLNKDLLC